MASILIRNLPEHIKVSLRQQAARHGHSMEEEARRILARHLAAPRSGESLANLAQRLFGETGGVDLDIPRGVVDRAPPDFGE